MVEDGGGDGEMMMYGGKRGGARVADILVYLIEFELMEPIHTYIGSQQVEAHSYVYVGLT